MKFPIQKGRGRSRAKGSAGTCLVCGRMGAHEPNGFAFLNGGALKKVGRRHATMSPDLEGFLSIGVHGGHGRGKPQPSALVSVAEGVPLGQFEYYFCSTKCLRKFLNHCVDTLEQRLAKNAN